MATTGPDEPITFVISVAAELAGMHPQTLRQYDRLGLVIPARTKGRGRRYTKRDVQRLRDVQPHEPGRGHQPRWHPSHPRTRATR